MFFGKTPFQLPHLKNISDLHQTIKAGSFTITLERPISIQLISFINCCLQFKQEKRYDCAALNLHEFITGDYKNFKFIYDTKLWPENLKNENGILMNIYDNLKMTEYLGV